MLIDFIKSYFAALGVLWLVFDIFNQFFPNTIECSFSCFVILPGFIAIIDGIFLSGFFRFKTLIESNLTDVRIVVKFGDLFKENGWKAIAVNDFFDSAVDERHVARKSLHGQLLLRYWNSNVVDWDQQIASSLQSLRFEDIPHRVSGKCKKYNIGATGICSQGDLKFLCTVLSRTNIDTYQTSCDLGELYQVLCSLCQKAREVCADNPLNIPLFGSGLSRTGLKQNILLNIILAAIIEESMKSKITGEIRIILPWRFWRKINLSTLKKEWS